MLMNRDPDPHAFTLLRVAVQRLSTGPIEEQIRWSADIKAAAEWDLSQRVAVANRNKLMTWSEIAPAVGTTPQAVHRRYRSVEVDEELARHALFLIRANEMITEVLSSR